MNKRYVEKWFKYHVEQLKKAQGSVFQKRKSEELFNEIYRALLVLETLGLYLDIITKYYSDFCKIMFGFNYKEIISLMEIRGRNNMIEMHFLKDEIQNLSEEEESALDYYHLMTKLNRNFSQKPFDN